MGKGVGGKARPRATSRWGVQYNDTCLPRELWSMIMGMVPCGVRFGPCARVSRQWRKLAIDGTYQDCRLRAEIVRNTTPFRWCAFAREVSLCDLAASAGHMQCLRVASCRAACDDITVDVAASFDQREMLALMWSDGNHDFSTVEYIMVADGRLDLLQWLASKKGLRMDLCGYAFRYSSSIECLDYLVHEHALTWGSRTLYDTVRNGFLDLFVRMLDYRPEAYRNMDPIYDPSTIAAAFGHMDALEAIRSRGLPLGTNTASAAASGNRRDCLAFLHGCGIVPSNREWSDIARHITGETLEYAIKQIGWRPTALNVEHAARHGNIGLLQYLERESLLDHDMLTVDLSANVARARQFDCLVYLRSIGCPWDAQVCSHAARCGYVGILEYAHREGCPWEWDACFALAHSHPPCRALLTKHAACRVGGCCL